MKFADFSENQKKCISDRNRSLLVSAAAGSGKTAVLVERIYQLIKEESASISDMLIVTFTNAAASEMKEKIREKLYEASIEENDPLIKKKLRREYSLVETANISTFHVFYLDVIKNFFYVNNYEPNLKFGDQLELDRISDEALFELVSKYFEEENKEFLFYIDQYCETNDYSNYKELIKGLYEKIVTFRDGLNFFDKAKEEIINYINDRKNSKLLKALNFSKEIKELEEVISELEDFSIEASGSKKYEKAINDNISLIKEYINNINNFDVLTSTRWNSYPKKNSKDYIEEFNLRMKEIKEIKDNVISDSLKKFFKNINDIDGLKYIIECESTLPSYKDDIPSKYHIFDFIKQSVIDYESLVKKKKNDSGIISFDDAERMAYNLLSIEDSNTNNSTPRKYYQDKFKYIFVDEYQDESDIQNAIIECLANDNSDNLFLVGDIKQSIYRFRNSEPGLFLDRINSFNDGKNNHTVFSLNENYRSKEKVVSFVNDIFRVIMPSEYKKDDELVSKCLNYDTNYSNSELWLINKEEFDDTDEELLDLQTIELESQYIVKAIKEYYGKSYIDKGKEKTIDYKDIVILLRTVKGKGDVIYKALKDANIPAFLTNDEGYYESIEISTFIDCLKVIDNYKQDVELISALRSSIFGFTFNDFSDIRISNKKGAFSDAFFNYIKVGSDNKLKEKVKDAINKIKKYKELSKSLPIEEFVWKLMLDENFYLEMGALPDGIRRQANLRAFIDLARKYRENFDNSLSGFIEYTKLNIKKQLNSAQVKMKSENDNVVRIMSIHKSKGLEFPFVIIPDAAKYKDSNKKGSALINRKFGIGLNIQNRNKLLKKESAFSAIINRINSDEELQEKKHLLYVGLTRAKDYLLVIGSTKDMDSINENSFLGMIYKNVPNNTIINPNLDIELNVKKDKKENNDSIKSYLNSVSIEYSEDDFTFEYDNKEALNVHSKYSVSELNKINQENNKYSNKIYRKKEENINSFSPTEIGSIVHKFLEKMDFKEAKNGGEEYLNRLKEELVLKDILLSDEVSVIDNSKILKFINTEIFDRAINSKKIFKEKNFIMNYEVSSVKTLCQGTIDCFFIEEDGAILIDYKTSKYNDIDKLKAEYSEQIRIYKKAISDGMGINIKESYLYLTNFGELVKMD